MKRNKATGPDNISAEDLQAIPVLRRELIKQIQHIWNNHEIDPSWTKGDTIMIYKKNDRNQLKNYRPITLLNHSFKVLTKIINDRLKPLIRETILIGTNGISRENRLP